MPKSRMWEQLPVYSMKSSPAATELKLAGINEQVSNMEISNHKQ